MEQSEETDEITQAFWPPDEHEPTRKRECVYRRGFHQGWDDAIDTIFGLWKAGISREEAYALCAMHENNLAAWRAGDCTRLIEPPRFSRTQTQDEGEE